MYVYSERMNLLMTTAVFLLSIIFTFTALFLSVRNFNRTSKKSGTFIFNLPLFCAVFLLVIAILGSTGTINSGPYSETYYFSAFVSATAAFISRLDNKYRKELKFLLKIISVAAVLELTLFNLPSYKLMFGNYPHKEISASDIHIVQDGVINDGKISLNGKKEFQCEITDIDIPVGTLFVDFKFHDPIIQASKIFIDIKDETQKKEYRKDIIKSEIITGCPDSNYILCDLSGNVDSIMFRAVPPNGEDITFTKIILNAPIPFSIQYIRFLLIVLVGTFIYCIINSNAFSRKYSDSKNFCSFFAYIITISALLISFLMIDYKISPSTWSEELHKESGNQVSQELVDAFKSGHVYLEHQPEDFLTDLDNPYDRQERESSGKSYSWDHVYYNGHYYSYYGIAPVFLLFLPYNLITGYYCPDSLALLIFSFIAITGITMMYMSFIRKWFRDTPSGIVIACLLILQISSGVWYSVGRPDFYENALAAGLAFISWAVYFLFESNIICEGKISKIKTTLSSLFFSIAVLCRPTLALYCVCAALFMILAVPKINAEVSSAGKAAKFINKSSVFYLLCAFIPMMCLGAAQMVYNYVRFGSVFDFGIQYSLTINDFTKSQFHFKFSAMAIYNYLFNIPVFQTDYPFVRTQFQQLGNTGFFYVDIVNTLNSSGLFMLVPPTFFYIFSCRALKELPDKKTKIKAALSIAVPCLIAPFAIIASVWESGYAVRYMADFSVEIIIGAYAIMLFIYNKTKNQTIQKLIKYFICFSVIWVIYVEGIQIINQAFRYQEYVYLYPNIAHKLEQIIAFWR